MLFRKFVSLLLGALLFTFEVSSAAQKPAYLDDDSWSAYCSSWIPKAIDKAGGMHFDMVLLENLALTEHKFIDASGRDGINTAVFGISLKSPSLRKEVFVKFPQIVYSAHDITEDSPAIDATDSAVVSIPDMFRSDMFVGDTKAAFALKTRILYLF